MLSNGSIVNSTYQIICKINEVNGRAVYRARHLKIQRDVVMRQISSVDSPSVDMDAVNIIKNISIQALPQMHDILVVDGYIYSVEEQKDGIVLTEYIRQRGRLCYPDAYKLLMQLVNALYCLHTQEKPITHANIIPQNVIVNPGNGDVSLINMDIAKAIGLSDYQPSDPFTAGFWAPEQYLVECEHQSYPVNTATDIYCLGCIMYFVLTGYSPDVRYDNIIPISSLGLDCKEGMIRLVKKMMSYQPDARYQDAVQLQEAIEQCYKLDKRYRRMHRRRCANAIVAGLLVVAGSGLVISGIVKNNYDNQSNYNDNLGRVEEYVKEQNYYEARAIVMDMEEDDPENINLYKRELEYMYMAKDYSDCVNRAENIIRKNFPREFEEASYKDLGEFYHVLGQAYYRIEKYDNAQENMELALSYYDEDYEFYRDYCLILVAQEKLDKAKGQISVSQDLDWDETDLTYVQARIAYASQQFADATEKYLYVIDRSIDEEIRKDAYTSCAVSYDSMLDYSSEADLLQKAIRDYPEEDSYRKQLAQTWMALAEEDQYYAEEYYRNARTIYEELSKKNPEEFEIQENIVILYRKLGDDATAEQLLLGMCDTFRDKYRVYMWLCYIEDEKQSHLKKKERNYEQMEKYYNKARKMYSSSIKDFYMEDLDERMSDLKEKGWFK